MLEVNGDRAAVQKGSRRASLDINKASGAIPLLKLHSEFEVTFK